MKEQFQIVHMWAELQIREQLRNKRLGGFVLFFLDKGCQMVPLANPRFRAEVPVQEPLGSLCAL